MRESVGIAHPERPRRRRFAVLLAAAVTIAAFAVSQAPLTAILPPPQPVGAEAVRFFDKLALLRGDGRGSERPGHVRKFTRPVAIQLTGDNRAAFRDDVEKIAQQLSAWTGVSFYVAAAAKPGHGIVRVDVLSHADMQRRYGVGGPVCFSRTWGYGGRLRHALIEVSEKFGDCLAHEFMHAVGFDNHWTGPPAMAGRPSVLALRHHPARTKDFSAWDRMAIRLLYDWRLPAGTPRNVALPIVEALVSRQEDT